MFSKVVLTGNYSLEMSLTLFIKDQATPLNVSAVELCGTDTTYFVTVILRVIWKIHNAPQQLTGKA